MIQFLAGILGALALILPGISFSSMLYMMGVYDFIWGAVGNRDVVALLPFGLGMIIGILFLTKFLDVAMTRFPHATYMIILGFVIGSIWDILKEMPAAPRGGGDSCLHRPDGGGIPDYLSAVPYGGQIRKKTASDSKPGGEGDIQMKILEERIRKDGVVKAGNVLKVDSFLNHQMDVELFNEMGREFKRLFADRPINKILTIEASGIGIACIVAQHFQVPVVFAKKTQSINIDGEVYTTKIESFTHKRVYDVIVSKKYIGPEDHILIIDDFLANGCAVQGLINLIRDAGATVEGVGIAIEKGQQAGGRMLRDQGIRVESLAIIDSMDDAAGEIVFRQN